MSALRKLVTARPTLALVGLATMAACSNERSSRDDGGDGTFAVDARAGDTEGSDAEGAPFALLTARIRRLANAEYDASVRRLLGTAKRPASGPDFPPDFRQDGFTVNGAQRIDAVVVERLAAAADELVGEARDNGTLATLAPCPADADAKRCATSFIETFGAKVYRRPLATEEEAALLALYEAGADGAGYEDGVAHVLRGLLQSAGFLYLTELGSDPQPSGHAFTLTPYEIAASMSYLITSAPPDDELVRKAQAGALLDADEREAQARRLLRDDPLAADNVARMIREWLGIDQVEDSSKDSLIYPEFDAHKSRIVAESKDFVKAVAFQGTGTVAELLGADWTVDSGPLDLYTSAGAGPLPNTTRVKDRVGILNQAAFLARYANATESHPVFRGVAVARRVACIPLDSPDSFSNLVVVPPTPDPTKTTRERFDVHSKDALCQLCHQTIDPLGFSFEHFDGMGAFRASENGKPVDSTVTFDKGTELDGDYADSNQLATTLSHSEQVRECFARFMFSAAIGTNGSQFDANRNEFLRQWRTNPAAAKGNILETLIAYVRMPAFTQRGPE
jgi:hypothetical protein